MNAEKAKTQQCLIPKAAITKQNLWNTKELVETFLPRMRFALLEVQFSEVHHGHRLPFPHGNPPFIRQLHLVKQENQNPYRNHTMRSRGGNESTGLGFGGVCSVRLTLRIMISLVSPPDSPSIAAFFSGDAPPSSSLSLSSGLLSLFIVSPFASMSQREEQERGLNSFLGLAGNAFPSGWATVLLVA